MARLQVRLPRVPTLDQLGWMKTQTFSMSKSQTAHGRLAQVFNFMKLIQIILLFTLTLTTFGAEPVVRGLPVVESPSGKVDGDVPMWDALLGKYVPVPYSGAGGANPLAVTVTAVGADGYVNSPANASGRLVNWGSNTNQILSFTNELYGVSLTNASYLTITNLPAATNIDKTIYVKVIGNGSLTLTVLNENVTWFPSAPGTIPNGISTIAFVWTGGSLYGYPDWIYQTIDTLQIVGAQRTDGAGTVVQTNDYTAVNWGQAIFSNSAATNANWLEVRFFVPSDFSTNETVRLEHFKVRLNATDTGSQSYTIGMASVPVSSSSAGTFVNYISVPIAADGSGAQDDIEDIAAPIVLTSWNTSLVAGQHFVVRISRDGAGSIAADSSTVNSSSVGFELSYSAIKRSRR